MGVSVSMVIVSLIPRATPSSFGSTLHVYILTLRNSSCIVLLILFNVILLYIIDKCLFPTMEDVFTQSVSVYTAIEKLTVAVGARVMLRRNLNTETGLVLILWL